MKIGEVAERVGVSVSALRMYEQRGLIEAGRSQGGTRHYDDKDLARFEAIVALTRAEVPISTLARLAGIRGAASSGAIASRRVGDILADAEADLSGRIAHLSSARADLRRAQTRLEDCRQCPKKPTQRNCATCPTAAQLLECAVMHIVWDRGEGAATAARKSG